MFIVMQIDFDPELHSIWGPFRSQAEAEQWRLNRLRSQTEDDMCDLVVRETTDPWQAYEEGRY